MSWDANSIFKKLLHGKRKSALLNLTWSGLLCRVVWSVSQLLYLLQRAGHFKFFSPSFFVGLELIALSLTSFSWDSVNTQEKKLETLTVSYSSFTGNRAPFWIAKEIGLYEKYGLDVKLVNIAAGSVSLAALLAGDVQLTTDSSAGVVSAGARGAPIITVSTNGALPYQLVALPTIRSPGALRGKSVGSGRIGAGTDFLLRRILAKLALVPGKDVSLIPTGVSESEKRIQLMFQGQIDATIGESDKVFQFAELGGQKLSVLGEPKDFGVPAPGSEINTTRQILRDLRPRLKAFFMAYGEAIAAGRKNRELVYQIFRKYMRVDNPKLLDFTYRV